MAMTRSRLSLHFAQPFLRNLHLEHPSGGMFAYLHLVVFALLDEVFFVCRVGVGVWGAWLIGVPAGQVVFIAGFIDAGG